MPQVSKVSGIFSSCLSVGKRRSKPGNNSFDFGRVHKCKNQKVLCTTFEPQILAGIGQFIWVGKQRWVQHQREITQEFFSYLQAWILPGPEFRTWISFACAMIPLLIINTDSSFVFVSHWYYRRVMAKCQLRGKRASCRLTDTIIPSAQALLELGTCDRERMSGNYTLQAYTISSLSLGSALEGPQWDNSQFPLVICQS